MTSKSIIPVFPPISQLFHRQRCYLAMPLTKLPRAIRHSSTAMRYWHLLSPLNWQQFPPRSEIPQSQKSSIPYAAFLAACLVKLDRQLVSMGKLRQFLAEHPESQSVFGFPDPKNLPTARHFTRMLRTIPNALCQLLLDDTVRLLHIEAMNLNLPFGQIISLDTKHILAWVKENNSKAYFQKPRFNKSDQPKGDPDCKLGCKRKRNIRLPVSTPSTDPIPAHGINIGEYHWGYASGIVVTKLPGWGEVVLAELTQPFDQADVSYFFPLMAQVERRLGQKPLVGTFDAAFDAFYVYEYFHSDDHNGFAAIPFSERGGYRRTFSDAGLPLCAAGLPMPLGNTFWSKTTLIHHQRGRYICPLKTDTAPAQTCPVDHKNWRKKGCTTTMPTSIGARLRYQLDRENDRYKKVYNERSATERINSQAVALGIERPKLRNQQAIVNRNTLIYVLINLRALHRIRARKTTEK